MADSWNVCGVAVYLAPDAEPNLIAKITALPGVDLHAASSEHRLAVTIVDTPASMAIDQIAAIHRLPGVVAGSLIFHAAVEPSHEDEACLNDNTCEDKTACCACASLNGGVDTPTQQPEIR